MDILKKIELEEKLYELKTELDKYNDKISEDIHIHTVSEYERRITKEFVFAMDEKCKEKKDVHGWGYNYYVWGCSLPIFFDYIFTTCTEYNWCYMYYEEIYNKQNRLELLLESQEAGCLYDTYIAEKYCKLIDLKEYVSGYEYISKWTYFILDVIKNNFNNGVYPYFKKRCLKILEECCNDIHMNNNCIKNKHRKEYIENMISYITKELTISKHEEE